jgi:hypothetical protein
MLSKALKSLYLASKGGKQAKRDLKYSSGKLMYYLYARVT